jgi:hypothetical protein
VGIGEGTAVRLHPERGQVSPTTFASRSVRVEHATDRLVFDPPLAPKSEARICEQLRYGGVVCKSLGHLL